MSASPWQVRIGAEVKTTRTARAMTQRELADRAGVAIGTLRAIEAGKQVRAGNLRAVLDALGIDPQDPPYDALAEVALAAVARFVNAAVDQADKQRRVEHLIGACATYT